MNSAWIRSIARPLLLIALGTSVVQCGGKKSKSSDAQITVSPAQPIVIDVDLPDNDPPIRKSWFKFSVNINNKTGYTFEIIALEAEITAMDSTGGFSTRKVAWAPSEFNYTLNDIKCTYGTFGQWSPDQNKSLALQPQSGCVDGTVSFIADGNPSGPLGNQFRYKVKIKPVGYFVDTASGEAEDRFTKTKLFYTQ